jgi:hypothetical protein
MNKTTPNNAAAQDALSRAMAAIKRSEEAIEKSNQLVIQLKVELKKVDENNQHAQETIDKDIIELFKIWTKKQPILF